MENIESTNSAGAAPQLPIDTVAIMRLLPHRYPFLMIDRVVEVVRKQRVVAIKNVTTNEPFFSGHFPGHPIMPGVLLLEALANLVGNAIKFTQEGGIVALSLEQREAGPLLLVRDNGPGIPPAEHEAVFRRFYRSDKSRHIDGSGLGLSLVAAIAKLHGFAIHLEDATPGCIFVLYCYPTAATTEQPPG